MSKQQPVWKKKPEDEDFAGALHFLSLALPAVKAKKLVQSLRKTKPIELAAKDLLRASNLPLLPRDEPHVDDDLKKIHKGKPLAPVLLVRGDISRGIPLIVADGYHRICAVYYYDDGAPIHCRIAGGLIG
jgi:hypothetical protein